MEAFTKAKAQQELAHMGLRGAPGSIQAERKWDPAPQGPGDLVIQDMEKAEVLYVLFCLFFFLLMDEV